MKKIAFGALFAVLSNMACAQSSMTLYGIVDTSIEYSHSGSGAVARMDSGSTSAARWGLRGTEDIGGGTTIIYKVENGFSSTNGVMQPDSSSIFGRESWIGANGYFGNVQIGVNYTPLFYSFFNYATGNFNSIISGGLRNSANVLVLSPLVRASNSIRYVSPTVAGMTLKAMYGNGVGQDGNAPANLGRLLSAGVSYSLGHFSADADFMSQGYAETTSISSGTTTKTGRYIVLAAAYDFGVVIPSVLYERHRGSPKVALTGSASFAMPDNDLYTFNLAIRIDVGTFFVAATRFRNLVDTSGSSTQYQARYEYPLSKATVVYAGFIEVRNGSHAGFFALGSTYPGTTNVLGHSVTSGVVGMRHYF
jgi:predicted porin